MKEVGMKKEWDMVMSLQVLWLLLLLLLLVPPPTAWSLESPFFVSRSQRNSDGSGSKASPVDAQLQLHQEPQQIVMDNGIIQVTLSIPDGFVLGVQYKGGDNILDQANDEDERGYWDITWNSPGSKSISEKIYSTKFDIIKQDKDQIELSFSRIWSSSNHSSLPLNIEKRFVLLRGQSGFYSYAIYERLEGWPDLDVDETRLVLRPNKYKFRYMALSDERQRLMPLPEDRTTGKALAYKEAVLLTNATDPAMKGEVDDKYQYSCNNEDNRVHGWISFSPTLGIWMITPSNEFRTAGPTKQDLTSHVGPVTLSMFVSLHYAGKESGMQFRNGEPWKKVFGPVFTYINSKSLSDNPVTLWDDAKARMLQETSNWPYNFPLSKDFARAEERGQVTGQFFICDRYLSKSCTPAALAHVGLAAPGPAGSWQTENKGYQFWAQTDQKGNFLIKGVRTGTYSLYAFAPGVLGDFKHNVDVIIKPGSAINLGHLEYNPPRYGPTLWEIGIPDRSAAEFFIPDPHPKLINRLYVKLDKFRQYGLWQRYTDLYPKDDIVYTVGTSDYRKDWFYAHVTRIVGNDSFQSTTWQIIFDLERVSPTQNYVLQVALAAATEANLQVNVNKRNTPKPLFMISLRGRDNAIARHGIHGLYAMYSITVPGSQLVNGRNTIFLTQAKSMTPFQGIMYDYIRLEGPPPRAK